eukprot:TRINITY_DN1198_c0_g1_i2.p1 TRINITY_DN1198_c0_g1~~TRINITY_DN1198_c0_g1_i2.p1  ORF type:complete len:221 (+),score=90.44 TRINITY_DN1198_c0_g1_i2:38-700(+)
MEQREQTNILIGQEQINLNSNNTNTNTNNYNNNSPSSVPHFYVNLDLPPNKRWIEIATKYKPRLKVAEAEIQRSIDELGKVGSAAESVVSSILGTLTNMGAVLYRNELKSIAKLVDIPLGKLVLMQLTYEASACCTSIVVRGVNGSPYHIRTMDWGMSFLQDLTIEISFIRNNRVIYRTTTWAGYLGILTGSRSMAYSVSVNFRISGGSFWTNFKKAVTR